MPAPKNAKTGEVVLAVQISGTRDGADWPPPGSKIKLPAAEAAQLIAAGLAVAGTAVTEPDEVR